MRDILVTDCCPGLAFLVREGMCRVVASAVYLDLGEKPRILMAINNCPLCGTAVQITQELA